MSQSTSTTIKEALLWLYELVAEMADLGATEADSADGLSHWNLDIRYVLT